MYRHCLAGLILLGLVSSLSAQIANGVDVPQAPAKLQGSGAIQPIFNIGLRAIQGLGYNLQSGAAGFSYDTANANQQLNTQAYINVVFVDSREDQPLYYETGADTEDWTVRFRFDNFTMRLNTNTNPVLEVFQPAWLAEVRGRGLRFGFLSQGGGMIYGKGGSNNGPSLNLSGANEVLDLSQMTNALSSTFIVSATSPTTPTSPNAVNYTGSSATQGQNGLAYLGYERKGLFSAYLSALSEGYVGDSNASSSDGWAFALNAMATPLGEVSAENPIAPLVKVDAIKGFKFADNPTGFGAQAQLDFLLGGDLMLSPLVSYDGRINDLLSTTHPDSYQWEAGGGLMLTYGERRFVADDWNELGAVSAVVANNKIQKSTFLQVLGQYSKATDFNFAAILEKPAGFQGLDPNLDARLEYVARNLTKPVTLWSMSGRLGYELLEHRLVPYARWFASGANWVSMSSSSEVKLLVGVQLSILKNFGAEIAFMSPQLYGSSKDSGKIELVTILATDSPGAARVMTPKTMNFTDWNKQ
jgi:hypothetical protein